MVRRSLSLFLCFFLLLFAASFAVGQRDGAINFSAVDTFPDDTVDLLTLVPVINIPIVQKSVGPIPGSLILSATPTCRVISTGQGSQTAWTCGPTLTTPLTYFAQTMNPVSGMTAQWTSRLNNGCTQFNVTAVSGPDGLTSFYVPGGGPTQTSATILYYPSTCGATSTTVTTIDGSGYTVTLDSSNGTSVVVTSVVGKDGAIGNGCTNGHSCIGVKDVFGNTVQQDYNAGTWTDTLGAVVNSTASNWTYTDTTGHTQTVSITNGTTKAFNPFNQSCESNPPSENGTPITQITYPDNTSMSFTWQAGPGGTGYSGMISSFTNRTGNTVSYTYGNLLNGCSGAFGFTTLTRTDASGSWSYTASINLQTGVQTTTVLDPGQNKTVYTFAAYPFITQVDRYQNTGTVASPTYTLSATDKLCYKDNTCNVSNALYPVTERDIFRYVGASSVQMSHRVETYDSYGNVLSDTDTDSVTGQQLITTYVYGTWNGSSCVALGNANIRDHVCTITKTDGNSHQLAKHTFTYNSNGATTAATTWISSTNSLTTNYTVNTNGTTATVTAPNGQVTTNTYGDCNSLLLTDSTTTVNSVAIDNKMTWDCNGGVVTDTTDPNGNEDDTTYDAIFRPSTHTDRLENITTYNYTATSVETIDPLNVQRYEYVDSMGRPSGTQTRQSPTSSNYDTITAATSWKDSGNNALTNLQTTTSVPCSQTLGNPCTTIAMTSLSNPMAGPISTTDANSGTQTWGLGVSSSGQDISITTGPAPSQENAKKSQTERDGFGRVKSVCAIEASGGTPCGQALGNSGILTSTTYSFAAGSTEIDTTRGSQTHKVISDAAGRVTSTVTPEAGTVTNYYDTIPNPQCYQSGVNESGFLTATKDAAGNYICPETDGIGRVYAVGAGSYCKRFIYDSTSGSAHTAPSDYPSSGANIIGRLVEAETDNCGAPWVTSTDEWFAYDKNGRVTDFWEATPNSNHYYHLTATYDADGTLTALSGFPGTTYYFQWGVDGEDRPNSMGVYANGSLSQTVVNSTGFVYDAASRPTTVPVGSTSGDQDTYTSDNVGNMTGYTFSINSKSMAGTLTWNSIGSLQKLAIADSFNSGGAQTCTYGTASPAVEGYDDVGRLLDANCGSSIQHDSWTYDQYDNASRTGNPGTSWNPGYSSTNNEMTGSSYDSNGNLTYDGVNSNLFNVYGQLVGTISGNHTVSCSTAGTTCATYDAFGRTAEISYNGNSSYEPILYSPIGRVAYMSGQSVAAFYVPAPGGGDFYMNGGVMYFLHPDWLGTKRLSTSLVNRAQQYDTAFTPYGETYDTFGTLVPDFTGLTQDVAPGLYTTPTRSLATNSSRWPSPDPAHVGWNAYSYPTDPNRFTDRSGLGSCSPATNGTSGNDNYCANPEPPCPQPYDACVTAGDDGSPNIVVPSTWSFFQAGNVWSRIRDWYNGGPDMHRVPTNYKPGMTNIAYGWKRGRTVRVWISQAFTAKQQGLIMLGIRSWSKVNDVTYTFDTSTDHPDDPMKYDLVVNAAPGGIPTPDGSAGGLTWLQPGSVDERTGEITGESHMDLNIFTEDSKMVGLAAHEEGHNNYLGECTECAPRQSVMWDHISSMQVQLPTASDMESYRIIVNQLAKGSPYEP